VNKYNERDVDVEQLHEELTEEFLGLIEETRKAFESNNDLGISFEVRGFIV